MKATFRVLALSTCFMLGAVALSGCEDNEKSDPNNTKGQGPGDRKSYEDMFKGKPAEGKQANPYEQSGTAYPGSKAGKSQ